MNVLILDHHFGQDIEALLSVAAPADVVRVLPAEFLASRARAVFPEDVFDADLARYHAPELTEHRAMYRRIARELTAELYLTFPFDVLVLPSDTFFYVRDVIELVREWGVPTVVVQKESGVSAKSLEHHASEMKRWFPFVGDLMTVCSEKSKEFWVASGARPAQVLVAGQPRFDVYATGGDKATLAAAGIESIPGRPVLLFLSYDLDAYAEERALGTAHRPWEQLHQETEAILLELAATGAFTLAIKPHPQQNAPQLASLAQRVANIPNAFVLAPGADTRSLLRAVDIVVGFQTTAIAEAMIAGRRVIYTFWTDNVHRVKNLLLPFHDMGDAIDVATSPGDLRRRLLLPVATISESVKAARQAYCEPYLGIVDGGSASRVWDIIRGQAEGRAATEYSDTTLLDRRAPLYCRAEARRAGRRAVMWTLVAAGTALIPSLGAISHRAAARKALEMQRVRECRERLSGEYRRNGPLRGPRHDGMLSAAWRTASAGLRLRRSAAGRTA